jgi:TPR repeat protein
MATQSLGRVARCWACPDFTRTQACCGENDFDQRVCQTGAALRLLEPLARQGDSDSQFQLSLLYSNGQGVPANTKESLKWLRLAARKGNASAQSNLGAAYSRGLVVPRDDIRAVAWLSIAAASGSKEAATNRQVALRRMTPQQISQANAMASACLQSNLRACD